MILTLSAVSFDVSNELLYYVVKSFEIFLILLLLLSLPYSFRKNVNKKRDIFQFLIILILIIVILYISVPNLFNPYPSNQ
tara:strand:- start:789 stop:1028 length:240 start_codon:yes stop_codon:yes gene_type:complete